MGVTYRPQIGHLGSLELEMENFEISQPTKVIRARLVYNRYLF